MTVDEIKAYLARTYQQKKYIVSKHKAIFDIVCIGYGQTHLIARKVWITNVNFVDQWKALLEDNNAVFQGTKWKN